MNCLSETEIQQYIDHELNTDKWDEVEHHLKLCSACQDIYNQAKESKSQLFAFLDEYIALDLPREIPVFRISQKKKSIKKHILITSIAATILLFIGIGIRINNQKSSQKQLDNITKATYEITRNADLNKMVHNKQIIVVTTDPAGRVIETSLIE